MNVPEIRFKEFCDYYSDVLLEKCLSVSNKKNNKLEAVLISFYKFVKHDLDECDLYHGFRSFSEEFIIDG